MGNNRRNTNGKYPPKLEFYYLKFKELYIILYLRVNPIPV